MLKGWWTYAVVLIAMLGALSACNSGDGDDDVVDARRYDFVTYLGYADGLARWQSPKRTAPFPLFFLGIIYNYHYVVTGTICILLP